MSNFRIDPNLQPVPTQQSGTSRRMIDDPGSTPQTIIFNYTQGKSQTMDIRNTVYNDIRIKVFGNDEHGHITLTLLWIGNSRATPPYVDTMRYGAFERSFSDIPVIHQLRGNTEFSAIKVNDNGDRWIQLMAQRARASGYSWNEQFNRQLKGATSEGGTTGGSSAGPSSGSGSGSGTRPRAGAVQGGDFRSRSFVPTSTKPFQTALPVSGE